MKIRFAEKKDLKIIVEIYNQAIKSGNATADLKILSVKDKQDWFDDHVVNEYPIYIIEIQNEIIGWGSLSPYRKGREALKSTAEISYYINYNFHGLGYGKALIDYIINDCQRLGIKNLFALLLEINEPSTKILEFFEFSKWGFMPNVAEIRGLNCGHLIYGKNL